MNRVLVWCSCGAASAVVSKLATEQYPDCEVLYCDTLAYEHHDNKIFLDKLHPEMGRDMPMPDIECGVLCINHWPIR